MAGDDGMAQVRLDQDTLARRRRVLGDDHPDTLARRRRVLGDDHLDTRISAGFASFLRAPRTLLKTMSWVSRRRRAG